MNSLLGSRSVFFGRGDPSEDMPPPAPAYEDPIPSAEEPEELEDLVQGDIDVDGHEPVVRLDDADDDEEDVAMDDAPNAPFADMDDAEPAAAAPKKRGRPSASASASRTNTPARGRPAKANGTASTTKPKAVATKKRAGRPPATRPVSARKAAVAAKKEVKSLTGRKAAGVTKPAKAAGGKRGRPAKTAQEDDDGEEYEVEAIVDDGVDEDTKQHMYLVKWSGYAVSDNTWEPKQNFKGSGEAFIKEYEKIKKQEKKTKKQKEKPKTQVTKGTRGRKPKAKA